MMLVVESASASSFLYRSDFSVRWSCGGWVMLCSISEFRVFISPVFSSLAKQGYVEHIGFAGIYKTFVLFLSIRGGIICDLIASVCMR